MRQALRGESVPEDPDAGLQDIPEAEKPNDSVNAQPGKCCISDDMAQVLEELLWTDVTIWSFPLYYFSVPGSIKNLMDRQLPMVMPFMQKDAESGGHERLCLCPIWALGSCGLCQYASPCKT